MPTLLQRQGIFTEAIAGRVPVIYDPTTTRWHGVTRTPFAGGAIPADRIDPVARGAAAALSAADVRRNRQQLPAHRARKPTIRTSGLRASIIAGASGRDQVFGRLTNFRGTFLPVTPLPDGSGVTTGTLGPQDTVSWAFASNYQRTFSANLLNELRIGDTRRTVERTAAQLATAPGDARHPGHSVERAVSRTRCRRS